MLFLFSKNIEPVDRRVLEETLVTMKIIMMSNKIFLGMVTVCTMMSVGTNNVGLKLKI